MVSHSQRAFKLLFTLIPGELLIISSGKSVWVDDVAVHLELVVPTALLRLGVTTCTWLISLITCSYEGGCETKKNMHLIWVHQKHWALRTQHVWNHFKKSSRQIFSMFQVLVEINLDIWLIPNSNSRKLCDCSPLPEQAHFFSRNLGWEMMGKLALAERHGSHSETRKMA